MGRGLNLKAVLEEEGIYDLKQLETETYRPNKWGLVGNGVYKAFNVTHGKLPSACYLITWDNRMEEVVLYKKEMKSDSILRFKDDMTAVFTKEVSDFWGRGEDFKKHGFLHRRGYILYGTQGTGKSSIVWQVAADVIKNDGVVFVCDNPRFFVKGLETFRKVEPNRPVLCVFEDIDAIIAKYGESELLSLLDGDNQIDKVVNVATTNYPERLDKRIVSRPRRFDRVIKIEAPTDAVREAFLQAKLPKSEKLTTWMKKTKGLSFAGMSECLISVLCLGNKLEETVDTLKELEAKTPQLSEFGGEMGFKTSKDDDTIK